VHADLDGEHDRLIQVDIHGDTRDIPHSLRIAAAARAVDGWKRPTHLADRTQRGVYGSLTRLDQTRALVRLQPGSPNVNSALSKSLYGFNRFAESAELTLGMSNLKPQEPGECGN